MTNIIHFIPRHELNAQENLANFIQGCRLDLTVFGSDLPFDDMVWDVTEACARKAQGDKRERISFCTLASVKTRNPVPMAEKFAIFAKAYIRYMQGMRPVVGLGPRVAALRALEAALAENGGDACPTNVDARILNRSAALLSAVFEKSTAYRNGTQLEMIAEFLATSQLTAAPLNWRSPLKRPEEGTRVGKEFDEKRAAKMPSQSALEALPKAYRLAEEPRHVLVTSIAAILCSAPDRINELLSLPLDCEITQSMKGDPEEAYGIRWWPSKGAEPMVKWVIPSMTSVVKDALAKIRHATEHAREIARWYDANPGRIFLRSEIENLRAQTIVSMDEINEILWGGRAARTAGRQWCIEHDIPCVKEGRFLFAAFSDVEKIVLAMLPPNFPIYERERKTKFSEALCVVPRHLMHSNKATSACMIEAIVIQHVNDGLGARSEHGSESVFDAMGLFDDQGDPICITTHQFRHYLNTLAQSGGLSQLDIAKWSGRIDINQNRAYDHVTAEEMVLKIRSAVGNDNRLIGPLASIPKNILISRDEFARLKIPTAHTTEFGFCVHDYTMSPCQLHRDCINCEEQICVKGDETKHATLQNQLKDARRLLAEATIAVAEEYMGADRWLEHHAATTARLEQLCEILDDPFVPAGSVIQLANVNMPSRVTQAEEQRSLSSGHIAVNEAEMPSIDRLRNLSVSLIK